MNVYRDTEFKKINNSVNLILSNAPQTLVFSTANTWFSVPGTFAFLKKGWFGVSGNQITYKDKGGLFVFYGVSDAEINETTTIDVEYGLFRNGDSEPIISTPHGFTVLSKSETIAATGMLNVYNNDSFTVKIKANNTNSDLILNSLSIVLHEV